MKDLLQDYSKIELQKMYKHFKGNAYKYDAKLKAVDYIDLLLNEVDSQELQAHLDLLKSVEESNIEQEKIDSSFSSKGKTLEEVVIAERKYFSELAAIEKRKSMELVMVYITPNDERDLSAESNCVTISVCNLGGVDISRAVPFNIWCEVERCIAKQAREITYMKYVEGTTNNNARFGRVIREKKYNVQIQERKDYFKQHNIPFQGQ